MTEEEKSVINKLESIRVNVEGKLYNFEAARILYLINKLQKENEKERNKNKQLSNSIIKIYKEQDNLQARLDRKRDEIREKDKQIDFLSSKLSDVCTGIPQIIEQVHKEYCELMNDNEDCCYKEDKSCQDCIREYSERIVKEEEK